MDIKKETLAIAKNLMKKDPSLTDWIVSKFPELKENEDERIRKALISILKSDFEKDTTIYDISVDDIIAWLEKQCNQKQIWHNEDEEPQKGSLILLIMQSGIPIVAKIIEPNHTFNHGERWAYIDDLLEMQGEQKSIEWSGKIDVKHAKGKLKEMLDRKEKPAWSEEDEREVAVLEAYIHSKDWSERHIDRALGIVDELVKKLKAQKGE